MMRKQIPEGIRGRMIRSRGVPEEVQRLRNLAENLGRQAERVCVTWSIFKLKNTSGVNYVFILGRSSTVGAAVTLHRYGSNDGRL
jgi:hypothetical protein